jgi:sulfite reductase beta subunit-like hemoprotein
VILIASLIVAGAIVWAALQVVAELRAARSERSRARMLALVELFGPARLTAQQDPRAYLVWQPLAALARQLFPSESSELDRAAGGTFPFTAADLQAAHAQWTTDWLAWERAHDAEFKLKATIAAAEVAASGNSDVARGKLDAVENDKLDRYQRRYAEYVRVAKALQALQP